MPPCPAREGCQGLAVRTPRVLRGLWPTQGTRCLTKEARPIRSSSLYHAPGSGNTHGAHSSALGSPASWLPRSSLPPLLPPSGVGSQSCLHTGLSFEERVPGLENVLKSLHSDIRLSRGADSGPGGCPLDALLLLAPPLPCHLGHTMPLCHKVTLSSDHSETQFLSPACLGASLLFLI